jgi:hypothetical protein
MIPEVELVAVAAGFRGFEAGKRRPGSAMTPGSDLAGSSVAVSRGFIERISPVSNQTLRRAVFHLRR